MPSLFTCRFDTGMDLKTAFDDLPEDHELLSFKRVSGSNELIVGFPSWDSMVAYAEEYLSDGSPTDADRSAYIYGYLLKFARSSTPW